MFIFLSTFLFFFFKQKTAYEMRISDWSSDVCSSDLRLARPWRYAGRAPRQHRRADPPRSRASRSAGVPAASRRGGSDPSRHIGSASACGGSASRSSRSEEHTSELQSLMRNSYAVFCLKTKKHTLHIYNHCTTILLPQTSSKSA